MKRFYSMLQLVSAVIALVSLSLLLNGCGTHLTPVRITKLSIQQMRQRDEAVLQKGGVQIIHLGETVRLIMPSNQLFQSGSANLFGSASTTLSIMARYIKTFDTVNIKVEAYSNAIPALTSRQAQVIASDLWSRGLDTRLMYAVGNRQRAQSTGFSHVDVYFHYYPHTVSYH